MILTTRLTSVSKRRSLVSSFSWPRALLHRRQLSSGAATTVPSSKDAIGPCGVTTAPQLAGFKASNSNSFGKRRGATEPTATGRSEAAQPDARGTATLYQQVPRPLKLKSPTTSALNYFSSGPHIAKLYTRALQW